MSKELQVLKNIKPYYCAGRVCPQSVDACKMCDIGIIENSLKVLEIIKEKEVEIGLLKSILNADKNLHTASYYNSHFVATYKHLTEEEFDLLKEALK